MSRISIGTIIAILSILIIASTGSFPALSQEQVDTPSPALKTSSEQEQALRARFLKQVQSLDDVSRQKEALIKNYLVTAKQIKDLEDESNNLEQKLRSVQPSSPTTSFERTVENQRALGLQKQLLGNKRHLLLSQQQALHYVREYRLLLKREEVEDAQRSKALSKSEYLRETHALESEREQLELTNTFRQFSAQLLAALDRVGAQ